MTYRIECVLACENHLGEGPIWDVEEGRLYWVDGTGRRVGRPSVWRMDPRTGKVEHWSLDHDVGAMALRKGAAPCSRSTTASTPSTSAPARSS